MAKIQSYPLVRFDEIAEMISERIDPAEAEVERYVGLEHLDPETLQIKRWGTPDDVKGTKLRFYNGLSCRSLPSPVPAHESIRLGQ